MRIDENYLLFDEPTSVIDHENIDQLLKLILMLKDQRTTVLIITHDQTLAKNVSDELIQIVDGKIVS